MPHTNGHGPVKRVCLGAIAGGHGVRGEVRIKTFTADPMAIGGYGALTDEAGVRSFTVTGVRPAKDHVIARVEEIGSREAAEALKGTRLYVERSRLPPPAEDEFYYEDLVGLAVVTLGGEKLGVIKAVFDFGAGDVIEIERPGGKVMVLPFTKAVVPVVDVAAGLVRVDPPEMLFEGGELPRGGEPPQGEDPVG